MFWADKVAKQIVESGSHKPYWVDDMKTPSGRIHVGSLRGVTMHDLIYKALIDAGQKATFSYVFDDHDPMDALPIYLDKEKWSQYLGQPLFSIPSPDENADSYARYFADEFAGVFNRVGCQPKLIWASKLYKTGKMNDGIKKCLDNVSVIRSIYEELYKKKMATDWYPYQVVCPQCGKESTTQVRNWDGKEVEFTCNVGGLDWTKGCGFTGKVSPFSGEGKYVGKLSWKVEWAVKWMVIGVTIEGAGKDHMTAGGSHDVASRVSERVLHYPIPYAAAHEFFLIGGKKMSSSRGLGSSAKEVSEILPPYLLRFIFTRIDYREAINFDPIETMAIPDLFDEYDRCWQEFNKNSDSDLTRAFEYAQVDKILKRNPNLFLPRFRDIANYIQQHADMNKIFEQEKGGVLTEYEKRILDERKNYAYVWIGKYAPESYRLRFSETLPQVTKDLTPAQREFLGRVPGLIDQNSNANELNLALYALAKELGIETKDAFAAIYMAFIGKTHGPRAAWFLLQYPKRKIIERLQKASEV